MKRLPLINIALLFALAMPGMLSAASYKDLTDECNGQILYNLSGEFFRFEKRNEGTSTWICTAYADNSRQDISPLELTILPLYANDPPDEIAFNLVSYTLCYVVPKDDLEKRNSDEGMLKHYQDLLKYYPSPRTDRLRETLEAIDALYMGIQSDLRNGNKQYRNERIFTGTKDCLAFRQIEAAIAEGDFQIAVPCYLRVRKLILILSPQLSYPYNVDFQTIQEDLGKSLRQEFQARVSAHSALLSDFKSACPGMLGIDLPHLNNDRQFEEQFKNCCEHFLTTRRTSEIADFPKWGSAMLGVLYFLPEAQTLAPTQLNNFKKSLKEYREKQKGLK